MSKVLLTILMVIFLFMITACNDVTFDVQESSQTMNSSSIKMSSAEETLNENDSNNKYEDSSTNQESTTVSTNSVTMQSTLGGVRQYKYKFDNERFVDVEEFIKWINETDPVSYKDGQFKTMLEPIHEDGYIYVPYYKNKNFPLLSSAEGVVGTIFEMDYEGHGYSYSYKDDKGASLSILLYYLEKDEAKDAKSNLWNYVNGKGVKEYDKTWQERQKQGWKQDNHYTIDGKIIKFGDRRIYHSFLYKNEIIVKITSHEGNNLPFEEFVKDLKFEKVKLN